MNNKKIFICTEFMYKPPLDRWASPNASQETYFKDPIFKIINFNQFKKEENNYLYLPCVPEETLQFLKLQNKKFFNDLLKKNIKILFNHQGYNLFMFNDNIFKPAPEIKNGCYDINDILYWKIYNILREHKIHEKNLYFIHNANGYLKEIQKLATKKVLWTNSPIVLESKHMQMIPALTWAQDFKNNFTVDFNLNLHYACLFAGRPASHRHKLIKRLWQKKLLKYGKCSLSPVIEDSFKLNLPPQGRVNSHSIKNYNENEIFKNIFLWVAGETYVPNGYPDFTEKTVKAILYERPFISYANVGTLSYIKDYGFKTFHDFWDESYDTIKDDDKKIEAISSIIEDLCKKNINELNQMYNSMKPIIKHNKELLIKTDWRAKIIKFLS